MELAQMRQAQRMMEGRIEQLQTEKASLKQELGLWQRRKSNLLSREEVVWALDNELNTTSTRTNPNIEVFIEIKDRDSKGLAQKVETV